MTTGSDSDCDEKPMLDPPFLRPLGPPMYLPSKLNFSRPRPISFRTARAKKQQSSLGHVHVWAEIWVFWGLVQSNGIAAQRSDLSLVNNQNSRNTSENRESSQLRCKNGGKGNLL
jgi:hypothetical protein